ncbi:MAG: DUF4956 domain-containing protein [Bacteroidota bacterium]
MNMIDFDIVSAFSRFSVNILFIILMIIIIGKHLSLKRYSFTFLLISLIVFFLCYTLKNFDLNLGMALGLFAIFGIIRYRTEPLQTEEMTYLFITIGMAVINALSDEFLNLMQLTLINFIVLAFIYLGELFLIKYSFRNNIHPLEESLRKRIVLEINYQSSDLNDLIKNEIKIQEDNFNIKIQDYKIIKIDKNLNKVVIHLFY